MIEPNNSRKWRLFNCVRRAPSRMFFKPLPSCLPTFSVSNAAWLVLLSLARSGISEQKTHDHATINLVQERERERERGGREREREREERERERERERAGERERKRVGERAPPACGRPRVIPKSPPAACPPSNCREMRQRRPNLSFPFHFLPSSLPTPPPRF